MGGGWKNQYSKYKEFFLGAYQTYQKKEELKVFLEIILSIFTISFFIFIALKPTVITILELWETIKSKEKIVAEMDVKIENTKTAKLVYEGERERVQLAMNAVPDTPAPESFSRQMEALASVRTVALSGITVLPVTIVGKETANTNSDLENLPEGARGLNFSLTMSATSYSLLPTLLQDLENTRRPIKVDSITISTLLKEGAQNLILALDGRSPYLDQEETEK